MKQSDVKRTRRDRGELEDIMFKLFERQPNWALKQLVQETDQPAVCAIDDDLLMQLQSCISWPFLNKSPFDFESSNSVEVIF